MDVGGKLHIMTVLSAGKEPVPDTNWRSSYMDLGVSKLPSFCRLLLGQLNLFQSRNSLLWNPKVSQRVRRIAQLGPIPSQLQKSKT
jgi:hypothetical protein